jgi:hypothetical protein
LKIIKGVKEDLENNSNLYREKNLNEKNNNYLKKIMKIFQKLRKKEDICKNNRIGKKRK